MTLRPVFQTQFGTDFHDAATVGNCYPACFATAMGLELSQVPHFYALDPDDTAAANLRVRTWLVTHGLGLAYFYWNDVRAALSAWRYNIGDAVAIFSGKSPRGDYSHAVLGRLTDDGWALVHDPHPSGAGIDGEPESVEIFLRLFGDCP